MREPSSRPEEEIVVVRGDKDLIDQKSFGGGGRGMPTEPGCVPVGTIQLGSVE